MVIKCTKGKDGKKYYFKNGKRISEKKVKKSGKHIPSKPSKTTHTSNIFNKFFNKIYVINLKDRPDRWKKVEKQFKNRDINVERFIAVDGRCKNLTNKECETKRKNFEKKYDVTIPPVKILKGTKIPLKELLPASSLTIGTFLILKEMVKKKWKHVLICEDDIALGRNFEKKFTEGVKELNKKAPDWDLLYLGCGERCGNKCVGWTETSKRKHVSSIVEFVSDDDWYVCNKKDLRVPCDMFDEDDTCDKISKNLVIPIKPGGTWCYGYSLKGAKKILKDVDKNKNGKIKVNNHVDEILMDSIRKGSIEVVAFDPPIVWHDDPMRSDSDIPWEW